MSEKSCPAIRNKTKIENDRLKIGLDLMDLADCFCTRYLVLVSYHDFWDDILYTLRALCLKKILRFFPAQIMTWRGLTEPMQEDRRRYG
ncbi:hypothetical protein QLX08_002153 [Tetragonisca angustula]|uniref:Uncharacterized protein n=1 Tax=Tetragonisca angustula TaxID=166442 RepID=A0AAW1AEI2_9HYME